MPTPNLVAVILTAFTVSLIWWGHVVVFFNQWLMKNDFKPEPEMMLSPQSV